MSVSSLKIIPFQLRNF